MPPRKVLLEHGELRWEIRYYEAGLGSPRRRRRFLRKADAERFEEEMRRRRRLGELAESEWATRTVEALARDWWELYVESNLASRTQRDYARLLDRHIVPRLGAIRLREMRPELVDGFRRDLERAGVGRSQVRQALAVLQGMFRYAEERGRVARNPVKLVRKPSGKRQRAVVVIAPATVEAIRARLLDAGRLGDATLVSVLAYAGVRPQEALALHWGQVRERTLLVDRKNVDGAIVAGQKRARSPRSIDLIAPLRADLLGWRLRLGNPSSGFVFPSREGAPWREHDWLNWNRRVWTPAARALGVFEPPYTLRHSYASLRIREGCSLTELAEDMGHSPQVCLSTYAHVLRELKGAPRRSAEEQVVAARRGGERKAG